MMRAGSPERRSAVAATMRSTVPRAQRRHRRGRPRDVRVAAFDRHRRPACRPTRDGASISRSSESRSRPTPVCTIEKRAVRLGDVVLVQRHRAAAKAGRQRARRTRAAGVTAMAIVSAPAITTSTGRRVSDATVPAATIAITTPLPTTVPIAIEADVDDRLDRRACAAAGSGDEEQLVARCGKASCAAPPPPRAPPPRPAGRARPRQSARPRPRAAGRRATVPAIPRCRRAGAAAMASTSAAATATPVWNTAKKDMSRGPPPKRRDGVNAEHVVEQRFHERAEGHAAPRRRAGREPRGAPDSPGRAARAAGAAKPPIVGAGGDDPHPQPARRR